MKNLRENILKYGVLVTLVLIPIAVIFPNSFALPYISTKTFLFYGVSEFLLVLWLYSLFVDKNYYLSKKQLYFLILPTLYLLWITIAGIAAPNPHLAFWSSFGRGTGLLTWYHAFVFSLIIISLVNKYGKKYLVDLVKYFVLGSFLLSITVWFGNEGFNLPFNVFIYSSGGGFLGNSSLAAPYLMFGIFFALYLLISNKLSKWWKVFIYVALASMLFSPLFVNVLGLFNINNRGLLGSARGATLGVIVGAGSAFLFYLALSKRKYMKIIGGIGIALSIFAFSFGWHSLMKPDTYLHNKFINVASGTRFLFWNIASESMHEHPLLGYGPENYSIAFQKHFDANFLRKSFGFEVWDDRAHNIYFDTGVSGGYPAILFYTLFLLSILYALYKANKNDNISGLEGGLLGGLLVGYVFQNLFVFDSPMSLISLFVLCGIAYSLLYNNVQGENGKVKNIDLTERSVLIGLLAIIFFSMVINFSYLPIIKSYQILKINTDLSTPSPDKYMGLLKGSSVGDDYDASFYAQEIFNNYTDRTKQNYNVDYIKDNIPPYLKYLEKLAKSNTTDFRLYLTMLRFYDMEIKLTGKRVDQKSFDYIMSLANQAKKLNDRNPQLYWLVSSISFSNGDIQSAVSNLEEAIKLDPKNITTWSLMVSLAKDTGSKDFYNAALNEAKKNIPDFDQKFFYIKQ